MCAHVVKYSPMAALNPVSDTHALLESMLQKLRLNAENNSSSLADMQTCSPSGTAEDSSKTTVYQFGFSSQNKEQDGSASVWNNCENSWTQQSSHFGGVLTPKRPVKRISKHNSGFSLKPKRPPLILGEHKRFTPERTDDVTSWVGDDQIPRPEKMQQFSPEGETTSSNVPPLCKPDSFQNPPDLLAPTLISSSSSVVEKPEVKDQSGTWSWVAVNEKIEGIGLHEQSGKTTKTSRKKWGEAKRWAQNVKERWRERHRSTLTRGDGERPAQNEVQSNLSPVSGPIDVNNTPTAPAGTTDIHHEPINTALDEDGPASLSYMSDSLLSFGTTSNLMEEIFSGTEWAQFLSVNRSNEPQSNINQSREEERHSKLTRNGTTNSHLGMTKPSLSESFASDIPVYNPTETSQMSVPSSHVTDRTTNLLQTSDPFTNELQNADLSEQSNEHSQFSQLDPNKSKATEHSDPQLMSSQVSDPSQGGTEDFIPLLDFSYIKPMDRSSIKSQGSLSRKREHWTKRRSPFEHTTQDMEDEDYSSSFVAAETSDSVRSISPTSSLNSQMDTISESSVSVETTVKKRRMEDTRRVRFSEEVIILQPSYLPEYDDDEDDDNECPEEPSPRPSYPKWMVSLKSKSAKYRF